MIRKQDAFFSDSLIGQLPGYFAIVDVNSLFLTGNQFALQLSGFKTLDKMRGQSYCDMKCKASGQHGVFSGQDASVIFRNKPLRILGNYCYSGNNWRILFGEKFALKNEDNEVTAVAQHFYDVTHNHIFDMMMLYGDDLGSKNQTGSFYSQKSFVIEDSYPDLGLSERETECFFYLLRGCTAKSIANLMNLSVRTIEDYLINLKEKLDCRSKAQLLEKSYTLGYMSIIPKRLFQMKHGI